MLGWAATSLLGTTGASMLAGAVVAGAATSPVVAVLAVAVGGLALRSRRWVTAGVAIVAGLLPWVFALPYAVPAGTGGARSATVRVLVVNAQDGAADPADVVAAARGQAVDLLVVTELSSKLAHELTTSGIDATLTARYVSDLSSPQAGLGIWSRRPIGPITEVTGTRWPAVRTRFDAGRGLTVVAGHAVRPLPNQVDRWAADLDALGRAADGSTPVVVLGNINGTPWNAQFRGLASGRLHDAADVLGHGIRPTWPAWFPLPLLPLDHALVGGGVGVRSMDAIPVGRTDHRALLVTLLVPA
jgi:endonuclease/exonuclease/phosphatase (EEP) superfamily protein YafD